MACSQFNRNMILIPSTRAAQAHIFAIRYNDAASDAATTARATRVTDGAGREKYLPMSSWARLLAIGSKEPSAALRKIDLTAPSASIGRKEGCTEKISDNTVSSVHCRIKLVQDGGSAFNEDGGSALTVWLEDTSANGTYVNSQKVGKGNHVRLRPNDEIGLIRPCGGAERPPWAFIFQDFTDELSAGQIRAVFRGGSEPEVEPPSAAPPSVGATPLATPRVIEAASPAVKFEPALPSSSSPALIGSPPAVLPLGGARSSTRGVPAAPPAEDVNPLMSSMRILAAPDPAGLRELRGTLRRGQMDIGDFVSADGPSALLDVISEVVAKPKLGWIDLEVRDGARRISRCPRPSRAFSRLLAPSHAFSRCLSPSRVFARLRSPPHAFACLLPLPPAFSRLLPLPPTFARLLTPPHASPRLPPPSPAFPRLPPGPRRGARCAQGADERARRRQLGAADGGGARLARVAAHPRRDPRPLQGGAYPHMPRRLLGGAACRGGRPQSGTHPAGGRHGRLGGGALPRRAPRRPLAQGDRLWDGVSSPHPDEYPHRLLAFLRRSRRRDLGLESR